MFVHHKQVFRCLHFTVYTLLSTLCNTEVS
jgi:hypothetical protein